MIMVWLIKLTIAQVFNIAVIKFACLFKILQTTFGNCLKFQRFILKIWFFSFLLFYILNNL